MKFNFEKLIVIPLLLAGFFLAVSPTLAFDDLTTHPAITDEIVDFYNIFANEKISAEEKEWIVQGVMAEDTPPRWVNHFYDPIYGVGWTGINTGRVPSWLMRYLAGNFLSFTSPSPAPNWLHNQELQSEYYNYGGNRTLEKAFYEYAKGNKEEAFRTLGHVLHLMEDMAVPDHTRDDPHAHEARGITGDYGSPLEEYAKRFTRENFNIASDLARQGLVPVTRGEVDNYFYSLSNYSNGYFFSKDTINDPKYANPKIVREDGYFGYGLDKNGEEFELAKRRENWDKEQNKYIIIYELSDIGKVYQSILSQYFSRLSREAIINGAGLIELFFKEGEAMARGEKAVPELYARKEKNLPMKIITADVGNFSIVGEGSKSASFAVNTYKKSKETVSVAVVAASDVISGAVSLTTSFAVNVYKKTKETVSVATSAASDVISNSISGAVSLFSGENKKIGGEAIVLNVIVPKDISNPSSVPVVSVQITEEAPINSLDNLEKLKMAEEMLKDIQDQLLMLKEEKEEDRKTLVPVIIVEAPVSRTVLDEKKSRESSSRLVFVGAPYPGFGGGGAPVKIVAASVDEEQESENEEESEALSFPLLSVSQCDYSLATNGCLLATTTVVFSWSSISGAEHYSLNKNGEYATTTELSFAAVIADFSDYVFSVSAINSATSSATTTQTVSVATIPIAINEVAWMGTQASASDEWLEIKNNTDFIIDLSQWVLESQDGAPYIQLSGEIRPHEYIVLERTNDTTTSIVAHDIYTGNLNNSGEEIILSYASTTLDKTPAISGGDWTAGDNTSSTSRKTMERIDSKQSGATTTNWATWGSGVDFIKSGTDTDSNPILGTPGECNSVSFENINNGEYLEEDLTLEEDGCFYVAGGFSVAASSTLIIEEGAQVSIYSGNLVVNGVLDVNGEENNPVVFDSFSGTKSNNGIKINGNAGTSTMDNVVVSNTDGMILDYGASLEITNAEFINNETGITLYRESSVIIENTSFASTTDEVISAYNGSSISMASSTINNVFEADAVYIDYSTLSMSSTTISNVLEGDAVSVYGSTVSISSSAISEVLDRDGIGAYYSVVSISDSTISNIPDGNGIGLYNSTTTLSNVVVEDTEYDGIYVGGGEISGNATIDGEEVVY